MAYLSHFIFVPHFPTPQGTYTQGGGGGGAARGWLPLLERL